MVKILCWLLNHADIWCKIRIGASGQSIDRTASAPLPGEPAIHQQFVGPVVRMEGFRELSSVHTRTTNFDPYRSPLLPTSAIQEKPSNESIISGDSKPTSLCVKPTEAASSSNTSNETTPEGTRVTVKLFGVPLHGQAGDPGSFNHEASEVGMKRHQPESWDTVYNPGSPRKYLRLETTPESRPSTPQQQVPWLQISATRDEGVYIWESLCFNQIAKNQDKNNTSTYCCKFLHTCPLTSK